MVSRNQFAILFVFDEYRSHIRNNIGLIQYTTAYIVRNFVYDFNKFPPHGHANKETICTHIVLKRIINIPTAHVFPTLRFTFPVATDHNFNHQEQCHYVSRVRGVSRLRSRLSSVCSITIASNKYNLQIVAKKKKMKVPSNTDSTRCYCLSNDT